jgi:hypothetical protein
MRVETKFLCRNFLRNSILNFQKKKTLANFRAKLVTALKMEMEKIIILHFLEHIYREIVR